MGGAGGIKGLDVEQGVSTRPVKTHDDDVRAMAEGGAGAVHKGIKGGTS